MYWLLHISNEYGDRYSIHMTEEGATQRLFDYCVECWDDYDDMPADPSEIIDTFFEIHPNHGSFLELREVLP